MAFFGEVHGQGAFTIITSSFQILDHVAKKRKRSQNSDLFPRTSWVLILPNFLKLTFHLDQYRTLEVLPDRRGPWRVHIVRGAYDHLCEWLRHCEYVGWILQIKMSCDEEHSIWLCRTIPKPRKRELTSWVHSGWRKIRTREGSNFFCSTSQKSSNNFSHRSRKSQGSSPQHLYKP